MAILRIFAYPLTLLVTTPIQLIKTLWGCRILTEGKWEDYGPQFNPSYAINNLWYSSVAINFQRFGRSGISPQMGLGSYDLSMLYTFSLPSLYALDKMRCMVPLMGMLGWLGVHYIWNAAAGGLWSSLIIALTLISSYFYVNTFGRQNYHSLGWMFFPIGLFALHTQQWWLAAAAWIAVSFGSTLAVIMAALLSSFLALWTLSPTPALAIIPAGIKLLLHFAPAWKRSGFRGALAPIIKIMGGLHHNVKYARRNNGSILQLPLAELVYTTAIYVQFLVATWLITGIFSPLLFMGILIFIANSTILRLHDIQTMYMMMMSLGTMTILANPLPELLPFFWLFISPIPYFVNMPDKERVLDVLPVCGPVHIKPVVEAMENFFTPVKPGERVIIAYDDPKGQYI